MAAPSSRAPRCRADQAEGRELKELEQDVRRAQSSNLIAAQNNYFLDNAGRLGDQQALQLQAGQVDRQRARPTAAGHAAGVRRPEPYLNYDENVASLQWDKLEKAQQVAVAKVAPLHVNLPTRGVRYSFSQVLQTELRKPMTIRLLAENTKVPSWTTRLGLSRAGLYRALDDRCPGQPAKDRVAVIGSSEESLAGPRLASTVTYSTMPGPRICVGCLSVETGVIPPMAP